MHTRLLNEKLKYDGSQLSPLHNYLKFEMLGDSCLAFVGACDVSFEHMLDGEDLLEKSKIQSDEMLHFLFEVFDQNLTTGVFLQRLFASIAQNLIFERTKIFLDRKGDDLYWGTKKLSISIASRSTNSVLVHFAMNITNEGTPVSTCSLKDLSLEPNAFAEILLERISEEYLDIKKATYKVKCF